MEEECGTKGGLSCKDRVVFCSLVSIPGTILIALIIYTIFQVYQETEFTVQNIVFTTVSIIVCLGTICTAIACRLTGHKKDQTSTTDNKSNLKRMRRKLRERCADIIQTVLRNRKKETVVTMATMDRYQPPSKMAPEITGLDVSPPCIPIPSEQFV